MALNSHSGQYTGLPYAQTGIKIARMGDTDRHTGDTAIVAANKAVAAQLRAERARADIKQTELAQRSGLSINTIQRLESGEREMKMSQLFAIASALGVDPGNFIDSAQAAMRK